MNSNTINTTMFINSDNASRRGPHAAARVHPGGDRVLREADEQGE